MRQQDNNVLLGRRPSAFKIDVADLAGYIGQAITQQPILIDMSEPRVNVVGVTGGAR